MFVAWFFRFKIYLDGQLAEASSGNYGECQGNSKKPKNGKSFAHSKTDIWKCRYKQMPFPAPEKHIASSMIFQI